jgi:hypothetical protein
LAASATGPQTDLAFSSNARPPKGTVAAFDFTDVGTHRRQLSKETAPFFPNPAVGLFDSPMNARLHALRVKRSDRRLEAQSFQTESIVALGIRWNMICLEYRFSATDQSLGGLFPDHA